MKRVGLFILSKDEPKLMRTLGELKSLHLEPAEQITGPAVQEKPGRERDLERNRRILQRIESLLDDLGIEPDGPAATDERLAPGDISRRLRDMEAARDEIRRQLDRFESDERQLETMVRDLKGFTGLGIPMERVNDFSFLHFAIGQMPSTSVEELTEKVGSNVVLIPRDVEGNERHVVAITSKKGRFALETELERVGFQNETVGPEQTGLADELVDRAGDRISQLEVQRELAEQLRQQRAEEYAPRLRAWRRIVANDIRVIEAEANFAFTEAACYITGWCPTAQVEDLRERVLSATEGCAAIELTDPEPGVEPPSKFQQSPWLRPFTMLVAGYGFPKYREIEPTIFVAISFLLMFGFMFGDVGHGAVLLGVGALMRARSRKQTMQDVGFLLGACGVSSMVFGVVFGSYFGLSYHHVPWLPHLWHEPVAGERTIETLIVALLGGTALISVGLVFNIVNRLRAGDITHGIFDKFGLIGAVMYWAVLWLAVWALVFGPEDLPVATVLWIILAGVVVLFIREPLLVFLKRRKGHEAESLPEALITAAVEVMEVFIGYLANTLSFLRLAAYAMSHFALLLATLEMSKVISEMGGPVGKPAAALIFVLGNAVIIVLEGLVAGIQAIRLEYYEFFGKFFSGTGRAYKPFEAD